MITPRFINFQHCEQIAREWGVPVYVYDEATLKKSAQDVLDFPRAYGFTGRYAMKAWSNAAILQLFHKWGLKFDASSGYEAKRAMKAGIPAANISLSTQELPEDFAELVNVGVTVNACSLDQLRRYGKAFSGATIGLRLNPGLGSGGTLKTNVGGPASSFGIWYELLDEVDVIVEEFNLSVNRIHTHIGSGSDPEVWQKAAIQTLQHVERYPEVTNLNLGGGFKVGRMPGEESTVLSEVAVPIKEAIVDFKNRTGRELHLEIEPGTYLVGNAGAIVSRVQDITTTGDDGHTFLKLDTGMTDILRPTLYAAQQAMSVIPASGEAVSETDSYIVVGHCCESGDLLTPDPSDPGLLKERELVKTNIGDFFVIDGAGAYVASMPAKNYNSFPELAEVLLRESGELVLIRKRQQLEQIIQNEVPLDSI